VNAATASGPLATDQRGAGFARAAMAPDLGAFELQPIAPGVTDLVVNHGAVQRSRVTAITVNLSAPIRVEDLPLFGGIRLEAISAGGTPLGTVVETGATGAHGRILVGPATGVVWSFTLTFDNADGSATTAGVQHGSLSDGRWRLTIPMIDYSSTVSNHSLHRLFGDFDGNATIDSTDLSFFGVSFGMTVTSSPADFDTNNLIDSVDFSQFGNRFGLTL
jgi:hypothetical protein